jgi:predicted GNAT family acetyltransferase
MSVSGKTAVAAASRTDQAERRGLARSPAAGIVREPRMGRKTVRRVVVSMLMGGLSILIGFVKVKAAAGALFLLIFRPYYRIKEPRDSAAREEAAMSISVRELASRKDLRTFIRLPARLHKGEAGWVPPLYIDDLKYFDPAKNPAFAYCESLRLLAERDGCPVGRAMGIINPRFNEHRNEKTARFGYLEAPAEDRDAVHALLARVEDWARGKGMTRIVGPYGFSDQDPEGFLIEGFENRATIATYYNLAWMPRLVEAEGYVKDMDYVVYKLDVPKKIPEFYLKIFERARRKGQFELLEFKAKKELKPWVLPVLRLMNEVYTAGNIYGYAPLDDKEMKDLAKKYMPVIDPRFIKVITKGGEVIAFVAGIPDMTEGIQKARGRLLPFGIVHILRAAKKTKQLDLLLGAVREGFRGLGLDVMMGVKMLQSAQEAGLEVIDTHHEMETNLKVRGEMERMGGQIYKRYRVFQKAL